MPAENNGRKYHKIWLETTFISFPSLPIYIFSPLAFHFFFLSKKGRKPGNQRKTLRQVGRAWDRGNAGGHWHLPPGQWLWAELQAAPAPGSRGHQGHREQPALSPAGPQPLDGRASASQTELSDRLQWPPGLPAAHTGRVPLQLSGPCHEQPTTVLCVSARLSALLQEPWPQVRSQQTAGKRGCPVQGQRPPTWQPRQPVLSLPANRLPCQPREPLGGTPVSLPVT